MSRSINLSRKPRARMQKGFVRLLATISSLLCYAFRPQQQNCNHRSTDTAVGLAAETRRLLHREGAPQATASVLRSADNVELARVSGGIPTCSPRAWLQTELLVVCAQLDEVYQVLAVP